jgi:hypothetical protein
MLPRQLLAVRMAKMLLPKLFLKYLSYCQSPKLPCFS